MKLKISFFVLFLLISHLESADFGTGLYLNYGTTIMTKNLASTLGTRWDFVINKKYILGGEFHSFISDDFQTISEYFDTEKPEYKINYGGVSLGYYIYNFDNRRIAISILFGSGGFHSMNHIIKEYNLENILLIEPEIYFEQSLNDNFAIGFNASHRFVKDRENMSNTSMRLYLKWGVF